MSRNINARGKSHAVRFSNITQHVAFKTQKAQYDSISKDSWKVIDKIFPKQLEVGKKYAGDKKYFLAVYFCIATLSAWRCASKKYKIDHTRLFRRFQKWYNQGIFADLLQLVSVCPELQAIEPQLIEMERIRQEKGTVPRIKDLQIKNNPSSE